MIDMPRIQEALELRIRPRQTEIQLSETSEFSADINICKCEYYLFSIFVEENASLANSVLGA